MKTKRNVLLGVIVVVLVAASFFAGCYMKEQAYSDDRIERCSTLISFALDKAENKDLSNPDIMKALISNVYAAYEYCDEPIVAQQLHDLWNYLIFESDDSATAKDILLVELRSASDAIKTNH